MTGDARARARNARARFDVIAARDGPAISPAGRSRLLGPADGSATLAVVFVHGFTNCPAQWVPFAAQLPPDVVAVIPRLPGNGFADRDARALDRVGAREMLATTLDAVDVAEGLAPRVAVAGLSLGGSLALAAAFERVRIARTVAIVPLIGLRRLPAIANVALSRALERLPPFVVPWDPGGNDDQIPPYAYPAFSTRGLASALRIGERVARQAGTVPIAGTVRFLLNAREPACNNALSRAVAARLNADPRRPARIATMYDLPANHDIVDPNNAQQRIALVYPRIRAALGIYADGPSSESRLSSAFGLIESSP